MKRCSLKASFAWKLDKQQPIFLSPASWKKSSFQSVSLAFVTHPHGGGWRTHPRCLPSFGRKKPAFSSLRDPLNCFFFFFFYPRLTGERFLIDIQLARAADEEGNEEIGNDAFIDRLTARRSKINALTRGHVQWEKLIRSVSRRWTMLEKRSCQHAAKRSSLFVLPVAAVKRFISRREAEAEKYPLDCFHRQQRILSVYSVLVDVQSQRRWWSLESSFRVLEALVSWKSGASDFEDRKEVGKCRKVVKLRKLSIF